MTHTIETRDPHQIRTRHPLHKVHVPPPDKKSAEWVAFLETVRNDGRIRVAISITKDGQVIDGWWRREAAHDLQLDGIPCVVVDDGEAALLIVETLTARKQMTRGAAVYLALGMLADYAVASEARRLRNKSSQRTTGEKPLTPKVSGTGQREEGSVRYLAERWGCGRDAVAQAINVRAHLHDSATFAAWVKQLDPKLPKGGLPELQASLRAEFEPLLFNGEKSLWTILQAAAGRLSTEDKPKPKAHQLTLFEDGLRALGRLADPATTKTAIASVVGEAEGEELDRLDAVADGIKSEVARRRAKLQRTAKREE